MNAEERARLRALADAATPGPWWNYGDGGFEVWADRGEHDAVLVGSHFEWLDDAAFIAAARTTAPALLDEVDRLTEALEAAELLIRQGAAKGMCPDLTTHVERVQRIVAEADLADEKRRHAELRAGVEAVVARMKVRTVDHRHEDEQGAASPFGIDGRAYFYAGDIYDDYCILRALLSDATTEGGPTCAAKYSDARNDEIQHDCGNPATVERLWLDGQWQPACDQHGPGLGISTDRLRPLGGEGRG